MTKGIFLLMLMLTGSLLLAQSPAKLVPLYTWFSNKRGDHFTTSDPAWAGAIGTVKSGQGDYRCIGIEGYIFSPEGEQPKGTDPLYSWWSEKRQDNFITSDPAWSGAVGTVKAGQGDYRLFRLEGYIPKTPLAGTYPLQNYWSASSQNNYANARPDWFGRVGDNTARAGQFIRFRTEGYVFGPHESDANDRLLRSPFNFDRLHTPAKTAILVVLMEWSDLRFTNAAQRLASTRALFSSTGSPNLGTYISRASAGHFKWDPAVVLDRVITTTITAVEAQRQADRDGSEFRKWELQQMANNGVNFSMFDRNRDGNVTGDELVVLRLSAGNCAAGQNLPANEIRLNGVRVNVSVNNVCEDAPLTNAAHEGLHAFKAEDIYGPGRSLNYKLTTMGANLGSDDNRFYIPDPWHRMQFGWIKPEVHIISPTVQNPGKIFQLTNATSVASPGFPLCVLLADPYGHPNEYFMLEYRSKCPTGWTTDACNRYPDNAAADDGLAIWHIMTASTGGLKRVLRRDDRANVVSWPRGDDQDQEVQGALNVSSPDRKLGASRLWKESHGEIALRWFNGTDTRIRLKVGPQTSAAQSIQVEMYSTDTRFTPGIAKVASPKIRRGSLLTIDGTFGIDKDDYMVKLVPISGGTPYNLTIYAWSTLRVTLNLPAHITPGRYNILVEPRSGGSGSNMPSVEITD